MEGGRQVAACDVDKVPFSGTLRKVSARSWNLIRVATRATLIFTKTLLIDFLSNETKHLKAQLWWLRDISTLWPGEDIRDPTPSGTEL